MLCVLAATIIQGLTSFTLTQLLSKSAQKMITDLRKQVQAHIGRLPVSFYDANKTGVLVSRIMSDVEGVRNLIGTGLVEFVGGVMTAVLALVYLLPHQRDDDRHCVRRSCWSSASASAKRSRRFGRFSARGRRSTAEVTGRLTESLGGVRVVKGYHAEEREESIFCGRRAATARQRFEDADGDVADESVRRDDDGDRRRADVRIRRPRDSASGTMTAGPMARVQLVPWCCWLRQSSRSWRSARRSPKRLPASSARAKF